MGRVAPGANARWPLESNRAAPAAGAFGWLSVQFLVPWLMPLTGIGAAWLQLVTLGTMALAWELTMPFVWLRRDGLT